ELAVFTILEPMDLSKYKQRKLYALGAPGARGAGDARKSSVKVLEAGIVGSLEYKILEASRADDLYVWLQDNRNSDPGNGPQLDTQAQHRVDLPGDFSYEFSWVPMWSQATSFAVPDKLTREETDWQKHVQPMVNDYFKKVNSLRQKKQEPATLEWARKITDDD